MSRTSTAGQFLVATPLVGGVPFDRAVVLVLEHDDGGAVGLVLNAATDIPVEDHLPSLAAHVSPPSTIHIGGPVETDTAIVLAQSGSATFLRPTELANIGIIDASELPEDLTAMRVFAGYAGWEAGQLDDELDEGAWWVISPDRSVVFAQDVSGLWQASIARAPGTIPFHRTYTSDRTAN